MGIVTLTPDDKIGFIDRLVKEYPLQSYIENHGKSAQNTEDARSFLCPRCQKGHLQISETVWVCPLCMADGNVIDFAADTEGDVSVRTVAGFLASSQGLATPDWTTAAHPSLVRVLRDAQKIFTEHFPLAQNALMDRGAELEIAKAHGMGWCPIDLAQKLDRVSMDMRTPAREVGLLGQFSYSLLAGRVTIPIHDHEGQLVGYSGWKKQATPRYRDLKSDLIRPPVLFVPSFQ